jgi:hypothetical protein
VKLSLELSKRDTGRTLYILDEPTTGLHFHDIELLLKVIQKLRDHGNTVVIIEHNLDVIKTADWLIDMGPEGGAGGGQVIAKGTPETVAASKASFTGKYLAPLLKRRVGFAARSASRVRRPPPASACATLPHLLLRLVLHPAAVHHPACSSTGYAVAQNSELSRFSSLITSRCSELVSMLSTVCTATLQVRARLRSRSRKAAFSAISCCALRRSPVRNTDRPRRRFATTRACISAISCMPASENDRLCAIFFLGVDDHALDQVARMLQVDRQRDDFGPALAIVLIQRLGADLRQVELDCGVEIVDFVVDAAGGIGQLQIVGPQHAQQVVEHLFDAIADAQHSRAALDNASVGVDSAADRGGAA